MNVRQPQARGNHLVTISCSCSRSENMKENHQTDTDFLQRGSFPIFTAVVDGGA